MENSISNEIRSQVLIDALPYIQKYNDLSLIHISEPTRRS